MRSAYSQRRTYLTRLAFDRKYASTGGCFPNLVPSIDNCIRDLYPPIRMSKPRMNHKRLPYD